MEAREHEVSREQRYELPESIRSALSQSQCPDCNSEAEIAEPFPGFHYVQIRHDNTCPWLNRYEQRNGS